MRLPVAPIVLLVQAIRCATANHLRRRSYPFFTRPRELQEELDDPYLWLEEIYGNESLAWVEEQNNITLSALQSYPLFDQLVEELTAIYTSSEKIPSVGERNGLYYNFWRDDVHERGILRRTTLESYKTDDPVWETVLDVDALAEDEDEPWVYGGSDCFPPEYVQCVISLSRGGQDASVVREFNMETKAFVEGGFEIPEALTFTSWKDQDTMWVGTDFGEESLTTSQYPRIVKLWKRGTPLESAVTVFEGNVTDIAVSGYTSFTPEGDYDIIVQSLTFHTALNYLIKEGGLLLLDIPDDAVFGGFFKGHMLVNPRSDWKVMLDDDDEVTPKDGEGQPSPFQPSSEDNDSKGRGIEYKAGSLLAIPLESFLEGSRNFDVVFEPSERTALDSFVGGSSDYLPDHLVYTTLDNVNSRMYRVTIDDNGKWTEEEIQLPGKGSASVGTNIGDSDFFITYSDFTTPTTLYEVTDGVVGDAVKSLPSFFDATGVTVEQNAATSKDGTQIPYYIVKPDGFVADGTNPTLQYGYGGFGISLRPTYGATAGSAWIEKGGVYVVANIRGGGEFGPAWHQAAQRENHQTNFDDFIAVAEDLIARNVTSPEYLGIRGGSQGGLLVGGSFIQRPDLFGAVVCAVPLLDMYRFNKLLRGASWQDEYGYPDTEDWENFIRSWSPYHNIEEDQDYPKVLFTTNTNDDRVHPAHARKMAAKMQDMGHDVYFFENTEGGHGGGASLNQAAYDNAIDYTYLWEQLRPDAEDVV